MIDYTELKRLAEAATRWVRCDDSDCTCREVHAEFVDAASPDVVLSMIAEIDKLRTQNQALVEALKGLQKQYAEHPDAFWDWSQARAAIKLAEGKDV